MIAKSACATLIATVAITASIFALPAVWAATPSHFIGVDGEPPHLIPVDLDAPSLVVHLNADGSLIVSQRHKAGGTPITLPSLQALPAEIDALVPRGQRKKLAVAVDATVPYRNFTELMNQAGDAGFDEVGLLRPEKAPRGTPSELTIPLQQGSMQPDDKALFVSLNSDGTVILVLGLAADAKEMRANAVDAVDAAASLVPKGRAEKKTYFRADDEVPVGTALQLLRELDAIGFTNLCMVGERG